MNTEQLQEIETILQREGQPFDLEKINADITVLHSMRAAYMQHHCIDKAEMLRRELEVITQPGGLAELYRDFAPT